MGPFIRWWAGLNLGWRRVNHILMVMCGLWFVMSNVWDCCEFEVGKLILGCLPFSIYWIIISAYQWIKEGFKKK